MAQVQINISSIYVTNNITEEEGYVIIIIN